METERKRRKDNLKNIKDIMTENFPNLTQSINLDIQEIQQATSGQTQRDP